MKQGEVFYYTDELNDEFSGISRNTIIIDDKYRYTHGRLWRIASFVVCRIIVMPFAWLYMKLMFGMKVVGRDKLKCHRHDCYFMYGNHTQVPGDGFIPNIIDYPRHNKVVVNADNVSLPGTKNLMEMVGAFPIPNRQSGMKGFMKAMKAYVEAGQVIVIYPEAHIWPYYTGIRPFSDASFVYPVMMKTPVYSFTVTYQKAKYRRKPSCTVYIDGPFYLDRDLKTKEAAYELRNRVYKAMCERSKNSDYEYVHYVKAGDELNEQYFVLRK